ncbi:arp2/3 complex [Atractiella rhizophila]|nr:arp2/3 complex [Atractiella rhizophila]
MADGSFRKIDIDAFDEDRVLPSELYEPDPRAPDEVLALSRQKAGDVRGLITRGDFGGALATVLDSPPYGEGVDEAKMLNLNSLVQVLSSTKPAAQLLQALPRQAQDNLMKYIYKGFAYPEEINPALLLSWHKELVDVAGTGCICRVITDRRLV